MTYTPRPFFNRARTSSGSRLRSTSSNWKAHTVSPSVGSSKALAANASMSSSSVLMIAPRSASLRRVHRARARRLVRRRRLRLPVEPLLELFDALEVAGVHAAHLHAHLFLRRRELVTAAVHLPGHERGGDLEAGAHRRDGFLRIQFFARPLEDEARGE